MSRTDVGLAASDRAQLESTGALRLVDALTDSALPAQLMIETQDGRRLRLDVASTGAPFRSSVNTTGILITPGRAADLGLPITERQTVLTLPADITRDQAELLGGLGAGFSTPDTFDLTPDEQLVQDVQFNTIAYETPRIANGLQVQAAISLVATLLTLIVVAIGLALSAIESRDERDVLAAMGAPPRVLRSVASRKALLMSAAGALVAVPSGILPVLVVVASDRRMGDVRDALDIPWPTLGALVFGVPFVASVATGAASAIAQRVRPTTMSTLRAD